MRTVLVMTCAFALTLAPTALAGAPGATTGEATSITDTSAVLNGTVNPNKEETSYSFQYGTTTAYGASTPTTSAGGGNAGKAASATVTGLAANTTYHFRLVATNASGTDFGADKTFTTGAPGSGPAPRHTVTANASVGTITFGRTVTISGQVSGPQAAGAQVTLQQTPHPFTAPFKDAAPAVAANPLGQYAIIAAPQLNTRYQVTAKTSPPATSPVITVLVRPSVSLRVSDTSVRRGRTVRFSGTVAPAHDGVSVLIQRRARTGWRTVARTLLRRSSRAGRSAYSRGLRITRTASYRVQMRADADHATGTSRSRRIRVR